MKRTVFGTIAGAAVIACVAGFASPAMAAESVTSSTTPKHSGMPRTLATVQAAGKAATAARIATLNVTIPKITANKYLSSSDRSTILATLNHDLSSMSTLQTKIAADTDLKTAAADVQSIYTGYRVYAVAIPQSHYAAAADGLTDSAVPALLKVQSALQAALAGPDKSKDTPAIDAQMADLATQISTVQSSTAGVSAFALSVTPAQFDANHSVLAATHTSVKTAEAAAKAASADAKAVKAALK
jgi:hypothetical protein